ncbi:MAG TPA: hypothetical protein VHW90_14745 [Stellaceae bacterium]|nr:hypothetical protein [Stellaceae bacterium]
MTEHDSKRIIRQWDREIEDEIRHTAVRERSSGPWRTVVWAVLWLLWLALLIALFAHYRAPR